jgi:hypothetical protein
MKHITQADLDVRAAYEATAPKWLGTLHERMKYLLECAGRCELYKFDNDTWQAIHDLKIEVMYISPPRPPMGKRHFAQRAVWRLTSTEMAVQVGLGQGGKRMARGVRRV